MVSNALFCTFTFSHVVSEVPFPNKLVWLSTFIVCVKSFAKPGPATEKQIRVAQKIKINRFMIFPFLNYKLNEFIYFPDDEVPHFKKFYLINTPKKTSNQNMPNPASMAVKKSFSVNMYCSIKEVIARSFSFDFILL